LVVEAWSADGAGVLVLPSGRRVRGRALWRTPPAGPAPTFGLYLGGRRPPEVAWAARWLRWPDFRLPVDRQEAYDAIRAAWQRLDTDRVEVACGAGIGRTGTALACLVVLDSGEAVDAVAYVRQHYDARAVETPGQRRYVAQWQVQVKGGAPPR
jgi:hypothetical protein